MNTTFIEVIIVDFILGIIWAYGIYRFPGFYRDHQNGKVMNEDGRYIYKEKNPKTFIFFLILNYVLYFAYTAGFFILLVYTVLGLYMMNLN